MQNIIKPPLGVRVNWVHRHAKDLVACWLFNEGSGTKIYEVSNALLPGSKRGGFSWGSGIHGSAGVFDGTDGFIRKAGSSNVVGRWSLFVWINTAVVGGTICGTRGVEFGMDLKHLATNRLLANIGNGTGWCGTNLSSGDNTIYVNQWYHVGLVVTETSWQFYINGVPKGGGSWAASTPVFCTPNRVITFGSFRSDGGEYYNGKMSEARVYRRAFSEIEVKALYADPFAMFRRPTLWLPAEAAGGTVEATVSDSVALSETVVVELSALEIAVTDSLSLSDQAAGLVTPLLVSVADGLDISDEVSAAAGAVVEVADSIGLSDTVEVSLTPYEVSVTDSLSISEEVSAASGAAATVSDGLSISEEVNASLNPYVVEVTDTLALSDAVQGLETVLLVSVTDSLNISEELYVSSGAAATVSDGLVISEEVYASLGVYMAEVSDTLALSDATEVSVTPLYIEVSDGLNLSDGVTGYVAGAGDIVVSDTLGMTEEVSVAVSLLPVLDVAVAEQLDMSEAVSGSVVSPVAAGVGAYFFTLKRRR